MDEGDPEVLLRAGSERSRRKLLTPRNLTKGSWVAMTDSEVLVRIGEEISELLHAIGFETWEDIADEAADVYHFALMGADPARVRTEAERRKRM